MQFLQPAQLTFSQTDQFNVPAVYWRRGKNFPLPNQWHLTASSAPAQQARFVTVVQVSKRGVSKGKTRSIDGGVETAGWRVRLPHDGRRLQIEKLP